MKNFKKEIENMPIVYFVNQTAPKIIEQAKKLSANEVEVFQVKKNLLLGIIFYEDMKKNKNFLNFKEIKIKKKFMSNLT